MKVCRGSANWQISEFLVLFPTLTSCISKNIWSLKKIKYILNIYSSRNVHFRGVFTHPRTSEYSTPYKHEGEIRKFQESDLHRPTYGDFGKPSRVSLSPHREQRYFERFRKLLKPVDSLWRLWETLEGFPKSP